MSLVKLPIVALVGRPNVGKSTLFNRLVGRKVALVYDEPGVTRDLKSATATLGMLSFTAMDTPGLFDPSQSEQPKIITQGMRDQAIKALYEANVILFVVDGRQGCTPYDYDLSELLRKTKRPVIVVVNKCEGYKAEAGISDAYSLGLGDVVPISAEHGLGLHDLETLLTPYFPETTQDDELALESDEDLLSDLDDETHSSIDVSKPLKLAIIGRPNVGKSTLVNALLEDEKQLTADYPGVTRDAISFEWGYQNRSIELVDTAGLRRKNNVQDPLEKLAVFDTERTIQFAQLVILGIDASVPMETLIEKQDLTLAGQIITEGRGLIIALNKWDTVKNPQETLKHIHEQLEIHLAQAPGLECVPISALKVKALDTLMAHVFALERLWNMRISTPKLNDWLRFTLEAHPTPIVSGRRIRLKYITQIKTRPPTFRIFCTKGADLPDSYVRYLINTLRRDFKLPAVPIRFQFQTQKNPYASQKKKD